MYIIWLLLIYMGIEYTYFGVFVQTILIQILTYPHYTRLKVQVLLLSLITLLILVFHLFKLLQSKANIE
jgi:hypothetical protein